MTIQSNLGSDIAMAFDECIENPAEYNYTKIPATELIAGLFAVRKNGRA